MFAADRCFDFARALANHSVILVNTRFVELGSDASQLFGRYIIALTLSAAFARGRSGDPVFLYVDEFQEFVDEEATARHFRLAREYNLGIIAAHQNMFDIKMSESLRTVISGNTRIKYCARVAGADLPYMLRDLGCSEALLNQQVPNEEKKLVNFACVIRGFPPFQASTKYPNITDEMRLSVKAPPVTFLKQPKPSPQVVCPTQTAPKATPPKVLTPQNQDPEQIDDPDSASVW
jgi:hypothetical protein